MAAWQARSIADFPVELAIGLYITFFTMYLMPKIAGLLDAMLTRGGVARYGGWLRFVPSAAIELVFSFLQGAVSTIRTSIFMIGLLFGKSVVWGGQSRDAQGLSWADGRAATCGRRRCSASSCAARCLLIAPAVFWWSLPLTAGYLLAIPFAVVTADPRLGRAAADGSACAASPRTSRRRPR